MDAYERRRRMAIGLGFIEEVVYDVLIEAEEDGEGVLTREEIRIRAEFPDAQFGWEGCRYILGIMAEKDEVVNDSPGPGRDAWRLAD